MPPSSELAIRAIEHEQEKREAAIMNALTSKAHLPWKAKLVALQMESASGTYQKLSN